MYMIGVVILFLVPTYYIAKSKGYNGAVFALVPGVISLILGFSIFTVESQWLILGFYAVPAIFLGIVWLLLPRATAPGREYLRITFNCPECNGDIRFGREREGKAELCPQCGALIEVPDDEFSPEALPRTSMSQPAEPTGEVLLEEFIQAESAYALRAVLVNSGIDCRVIEGGVAYPLGLMEGHRVMIDAKDWAQAQSVLTRGSADYSLPDDFVPPPAEEEPVPQTSAFPVILLCAIAYTLVMPAVIFLVVQPFVPHAIDFNGAFTFTVCSALIFGCIATIVCARKQRSSST